MTLGGIGNAYLACLAETFFVLGWFASAAVALPAQDALADLTGGVAGRFYTEDVAWPYHLYSFYR